ncbi:hypothetical protein MHB77_29495 [Paenibacillus sp. FSL K6-3166]|uniref:hypothetical protein n=1 Tax=unclassified Paenibacillus TaxID=185978 RepID=UPI000BA14DC2|nr:hypothetical protein [Paenibacillus sp. VTT E-133291]OZQ95861.1 hypothetical protein CA598_08510 [Paenibacillus sp. VTT E-133291]
MLSDTARKLLMIMRHSSVHHWHMPSLKELEIKSGRKAAAVKDGLKELAAENYIEWNSDMPTETVVILEGWPRTDKIYVSGRGHWND